MKKYEKICEYCGKQFVTHSKQQKYCDCICAEDARRMRMGEFRERRREEVVEKKKGRERRAESLGEVCRMAKEKGLSYGQYVAKYLV